MEMPAGIYITALTSESPAYNAGLQPGDILDGINDVKIEGMKNFQAQVEKTSCGRSHCSNSPEKVMEKMSTSR